ncbi:PRA1 family protein 3 [Zootermopsis nevadensis]|uniref:PRA1 family protein n=1 Tax=Zootermopsis nevadensis TaxID=136037 RepID=A0A067RKY9_ZOONE|nr:PRA1 family protein 3 [Zootermopsis nevadensis]KDR23648.1 PRA1 family protein 3 [Zootermopsis nevadensis]
MTKKKMEVEISPLRSLDDFLLVSARFQIPNFKDFEKWGNRVISNLLYYQTNYFVLSIVIFILVGIIHPMKMLCGMLAIGVAFGLFYYLTNARRSATRFKKDHPVISVLIVLGGGYFIVYMLGSVIIFLLGILLPVVVTFIHSSMRLRNVKNKLVNKMEVIGLKRTPMGLFLDAMDLHNRHRPEANASRSTSVPLGFLGPSELHMLKQR